MSAKTKFGLAILTVAFLLLNPIGFCTSVSVPSTPAHPCCPEKPAPPPDCNTPACVCADTPQAPVTVPPNADHGFALDLTLTVEPAEALVGVPEKLSTDPILPGSQGKYLTIHQFLV
jgi:hypothetical protein